MSESVQELYRSSEARVRASFGGDRAAAAAFYADYLAFVAGVCPPGETAGAVRLLDVGCGTGWSTHLFAAAGYDGTGIDLNAAVFEAPAGERCRLVEGSATALPFAADSFGVVGCYQCLEHVPDPGQALAEMARVCRPGGVVVVVGPNLVSPVPGLAYIARPSSWRSSRFRRRPDMPRHPYGNTLPEVVGVAALRGCQLLAKLARRTPRFTMRVPDPVPPFHADNDACYLCNPTDQIAFFRSIGFTVLRRGKPGRPPLAYLFAGGTWVAARKPAA